MDPEETDSVTPLSTHPVKPDKLVRHRVGFDVTLEVDIISSSQIVGIQRFTESE